MSELGQERASSMLEAVSTALTRLHKEQFGRGPTSARSEFVGEDALVVVMRDALLPVERRMRDKGQEERVRENRVAFQTASQEEFIAAVEQITHRKVFSFASALDVKNGIAYENFVFEPREP